MNPTLKKILCFLGICGWVLGTIGGLGYLIFNHEFAVAGGVAVLSGLSFPTLKKCIKEITE